MEIFLWTTSQCVTCPMGIAHFRQITIDTYFYMYEMYDNLRGVQAKLLVRVDGDEDGGHPGVDLIPLEPATQQLEYQEIQNSESLEVQGLY